MIQKNEIVERRREIAEIRHADSVFRDIQARENEREDYEQRWFWELLQNAKDSVEETEKVNVKVEIEEDKISFSHTGNPFELDDILSLIIQGSSKVSKEGKTGRFGTGFMTTYLLSKEVKISGKLSNNQGCFEFILDRNAETNTEFYGRQTKSNNDFDNSIREESYLGDTPFQTRFVYTLNQKGRHTAEIGLQSLEELIPFTQLFNDQIESVIVKKANKHYTYNKKLAGRHKIKDQLVNEWTLETNINNSIEKSINAYVINGSSYEVCLITAEEKEGETILNLNENSPRLYFTFPLIGTEEIGIPFIINSQKFDPRTERDGVYLKKLNDKTDEATNKQIISSALLESSKVFAHLVIEKKIHGAYRIFDYKVSKDYKWMDQDWFSDIKQKVIQSLSSIPLIFTDVNDGALKSLSETTIPFSNKEKLTDKLWTLMNSVEGVFIPITIVENNCWIKVMENIAALGNEEIFSLKPILGIKELITIVEATQTLAALKDKLRIQEDKWLNDFYSLVLEYSESFPLERKILLNQENHFRNGEGMNWDHCDDEKLNSISNLLDLNFSDKFISKIITPFHATGIDKFTKQEGLNEIKNHLNNLSESSFVELNIQQANAEFLKWLISGNHHDIIGDLKIISGNKKEEDNISATPFPKGKHLLLTPKVFFEKAYPLYAAIIRERDCMHSIYNSFLADADYLYLNDNGFVHYSPLVIRTEKIDPKTIELLITNSNDLSLLKDEEGKIKQNIELTYTDFAYLTNSDGHIYDRNSTPKASLERFKFLLMEASEKDTLFDDCLQEVKIENENKSVFFHKLLWLCRAKKLQWVYVKNEADENDKKFSSETPSSKNLSELIKNEESLIKAIKGDRQQTFLNRLGVGVSDLIRNTLPSDELRNSWDKAITNMITSDADPELVQEIFNDPSIRKEYERRLKERKLINRNQIIGALIEKLFNDVINVLREKGYSVDIKREPFGSDYLLSEDSSDLVNDKNEREGFKIDNWLVELKATGKDHAAMTPLQAQTASINKDHYALVVVPLDGTEPDLNYVKLNARVISNIGEKIGRVIGDFNEVESKKTNLCIGKEGVSVNIEDHNVRFKIDSTLWDLGCTDTIESFIYNNFTSSATIQ